MGMGMMGFGLLMMVIGLVVLIALIAIAVWAVIYFTGSGRSQGQARFGLARSSISAMPGARTATTTTSRCVASWADPLLAFD